MSFRGRGYFILAYSLLLISLVAESSPSRVYGSILGFLIDLP
jgi:hypothetical protein